MAITAWHDAHERPAGGGRSRYARSLAARWFDAAAEPGRSNGAARCSWCRTPVPDAAVIHGGDPFCSSDCVQAVQIAGLYLG